VRLVTSAQTFPVSSTARRADVIATLGLEPSAAGCGFVIEGKLPPGAWLATLEASGDGRHWQAVRQLALVATPGELQASIEWPAEPAVRESVRVQGWCVHSDFPLTEVWLHYGNRRVRCNYGLPRTDVPGLFPGAPNAAHAGFIAEKNLPVGCGPLRIRAVTSSGESVFAHPPVTIDIARDEENPEPLDLHGRFADLGPVRRPAATPSATGPADGAAHRVLFVHYGDFTSNSALHVSGLANALIAQGQECVVAVPHNVETIRYHPSARFRAVSFEECLKNPAVFPGDRTADIVHAWTTRENVRQFCERIRADSASQLIIHLEDHELRILEATTGRSLASLLALPGAELDALVPASLSHPRHSRTFLESADAATLIIDRLRELVPAEKLTHVICPAANETGFFPRTIPWAMRRALGWGEEHTVLFYHGNVHATNAAEMRELYAAVLQLNEAGQPTTLIRAGRDDGDFLGELGPRVAPHVIALGQVDHHHHLPPLMALADFFVQPGVPDAFNDYRFPSKLPEFFALGRPVILPRTNLGEILRHGEDAWVLPKADAAGIAEAVRLLREDAGLRARLTAGAASVSARYFNWPRSATALLAFYNSLPSRV
jgi:glycosyltransferase involved in cell wall biosynthesis